MALVASCLAASMAVAASIGAADGSASRAFGSRSASSGHTLVVDTAFSIKTLDPERDNTPTPALVFHQIYDTLLTLANGNSSQLVPDLATSWTANKTDTRFVFRLRSGVRFSDGTPLTSADVVFSLMRLKYLGAPNSDVMKNVVATAPNKSTVVLTSDQPYPSLPQVMTFEATGVVNAKAVIAHGGTDAPNAAATDQATPYLSSHSEGSGPYMLESTDLTSQIILVANPQHRPLPTYTRVVIQNVTSAAQQRLDVTSGAAQIATSLGGDLLYNLPSNLYVRGDTPDRGYFIQLNMDPSVSEVSSNAAFREAVRYALDYKGLRRLVPNTAEPLPSIIPPGFPGALPAKYATQQNLALARAALTRSGLKNPTIPMAYIGNFTYDGVSFDTVAQKIKSDLGAIGINVQLQPVTNAGWNAILLNGTAAMGMGPRRARYVDMSAFDFLGPDQPFGRQVRYTSANAAPAVVSALHAAETTLDPLKRAAAYGTFQRELIASNGPWIPLFATRTEFVASRTVTNLKPLPTGWNITFAELGYK